MVEIKINLEDKRYDAIIKEYKSIEYIETYINILADRILKRNIEKEYMDKLAKFQQLEPPPNIQMMEIE